MQLLRLCRFCVFAIMLRGCMAFSTFDTVHQATADAQPLPPTRAAKLQPLLALPCCPDCRLQISSRDLGNQATADAQPLPPTRAAKLQPLLALPCCPDCRLQISSRDLGNQAALCHYILDEIRERVRFICLTLCLVGDNSRIKIN